MAETPYTAELVHGSLVVSSSPGQQPLLLVVSSLEDDGDRSMQGGRQWLHKRRNSTSGSNELAAAHELHA